MVEQYGTLLNNILSLRNFKHKAKETLDGTFESMSFCFFNGIWDKQTEFASSATQTWRNAFNSALAKRVKLDLSTRSETSGHWIYFDL